MRKAIILAGGTGSRLFPITRGISKQLLPVYNKPMIFYPLSVLLLGGMRDILLISGPQEIGGFQRLLGDGRHFGARISYAIQDSPRGLADAFIVGRDFIGGDPVALILGDNIFYGHSLPELLQMADTMKDGASVFAYRVTEPQYYGVIAFDNLGRVTSIEEKPVKPKSYWAVTGLYYYDNDVIEIASRVKPSKRGELEITDVNSEYLRNNRLQAIKLGRGYAWMDAGTEDSLLETSQFVASVERRQGIKIACLEEIAWKKGFIGLEQLEEAAKANYASSYGRYLCQLAEDGRNGIF